MKLAVSSHTWLGKLSAIFSGAFVILFVLKVAWQLRLPTFAIFAFGLVGLATGVIAFIKKDRSVLLFLSLLVGLFVAIWILAELLFPH